MEKSTIAYKSHDGRTYNISIHEDKENWFVDFNTGLGKECTPKRILLFNKQLRTDHIFE